MPASALPSAGPVETFEEFVLAAACLFLDPQSVSVSKSSIKTRIVKVGFITLAPVSTDLSGVGSIYAKTSAESNRQGKSKKVKGKSEERRASLSSFTFTFYLFTFTFLYVLKLSAWVFLQPSFVSQVFRRAWRFPNQPE